MAVLTSDTERHRQGPTVLREIKPKQQHHKMRQPGHLHMLYKRIES